MIISAFNDIVEIRDDYDRTFAFDPYLFQTLDIAQYADNSVILNIRWGITTTDAGFPDSFGVRAQYKTMHDALQAKAKFYEVLNFAKVHRQYIQRCNL